MSDKLWKKAERDAAKILGGYRRLRHTGEPGDDPGDVIGGQLPYIDAPLFVDVKLREKHSAINLCKDVEAKANKQIPLLLLREKGNTSFYAVIELDKLFGLLEIAHEQGVKDAVRDLYEF